MKAPHIPEPAAHHIALLTQKRIYVRRLADTVKRTVEMNRGIIEEMMTNRSLFGTSAIEVDRKLFEFDNDA